MSSQDNRSDSGETPRDTASSPPFSSPEQHPLITPDLPGTGGALGGSDDFEVEELPAYLPRGTGQHLFVWIEKREMTTPAAVQSLASALRVQARSIGHAGLKDRSAVTRQWLSIEGDGSLETRLARAELPDRLRVLVAARHENKLRTGHLRGNRFRAVLRGCQPDGLARARAVLAALEQRQLPNYYGPQRFGRRGDNASRGLALLRGEGRRPRDKRQYRLLISSLQAQLFNEFVARRLRDRTLHTVLDGDVLQKRDSGALFVSEQRELDQKRLQRGEIALTGPICGPRAVAPRSGSDAEAWEAEMLDRLGVSHDAFRRFGRLARGGRRPLTVKIEQATAMPTGDGGIELRFSLPAGSYATVLLREVSKSS